jgi:hypothetical protein
LAVAFAIGLCLLAGGQVIEVGPLVALALANAGERLLAFVGLATLLDAGVDPLLFALLDQLLLRLLAASSLACWVGRSSSLAAQALPHSSKATNGVMVRILMLLLDLFQVYREWRQDAQGPVQ